jgi:signal transduction histidine kinase
VAALLATSFLARATIRQAIAMLQATAQAKGIGLEAGVDTRIPFLYADPNRDLQVLSNLVENAIKFTPNDGSVMVKACLTENDPDFVHVSVTDTGRGISPEAKALIFERLYQDPNSIDDSRKGLGLYISRELVRLDGGQIWVESQLSHGNTFIFTPPLFSLAKFLAPIITSQGRLRPALALISVELTPQVIPFAGNWQDIRQHCLQMLELAFSATRTRSCLP